MRQNMLLPEVIIHDMARKVARIQKVASMAKVDPIYGLRGIHFIECFSSKGGVETKISIKRNMRSLF